MKKRLNISPKNAQEEIQEQEQVVEAIKFNVDMDLLLEHLLAISTPINKNIIYDPYDYVDRDEFENYNTNTSNKNVNIERLLSASTRELMRRLTIYASQLTSVKLSVLRNTHIQSLSIFFGLCCSSSGYIFDAITGASSYPCPVK